MQEIKCLIFLEEDSHVYHSICPNKNYDLMFNDFLTLSDDIYSAL